ncbi:hypothetical protein N7481_001162 [Penicillium waksmanii]|uniref:uncharacterized protein n=1 Tax=Penicillium waksmanii TaxID=69791 RepID=UPI0025472086|nr:uncharacterized protein N7481_001162 [Penicillium waksmanii]KAJ6000753.1 hypothetical protein N7481_001162 [Penicillium waksmanii]
MRLYTYCNLQPAPQELIIVHSWNSLDTITTPLLTSHLSFAIASLSRDPKPPPNTHTPRPTPNSRLRLPCLSKLTPPELSFKRPFNQEVCQILRLRNAGQDSVVFKVKTTAPKHYCVRPNSGRIEPGRAVEVQVLLQALKDEPATDAKCKDKFLVQSVAVSPDMEHANVTSIFERSPKSAMVERKIRVMWLAADATLPESKGNDSVCFAAGLPTYHAQSLPLYRSWTKSLLLTTPPVEISKRLLLPPKRPSNCPPSPPPISPRSPSPSPPQPSEPATAFSNAKAAVASVLPSSDELKAQLAEANAQIQRLKDRLADQGLRQRKTGGDAKAAPAAMQQSHQQTESGVPVQMVAGLCLISFLIAYFFF